jgi:hypothetical protein
MAFLSVWEFFIDKRVILGNLLYVLIYKKQITGMQDSNSQGRQKQQCDIE